MDKFTKMASPLALVAGMAGFGLAGTALASGPGDYASGSWITPPVVQNTQDAVQWDDLGTSGVAVETVEQYEYLPPVATAEATTPFAAPTIEYATAPVTSATTQSYQPPAPVAPYTAPAATAPYTAPVQRHAAPAPRHAAPTPCAAKTVAGPCGVAPHPHPHQRPYAAPMFFAPQAPFYRPPAPVYHQPVPQFRDRVVEKKVFVDRPIERKVFVNRPIYIDRPVYVPRNVPVDRPVPVPVDRPVYVEKRIAVPTPVAVPVDRPVYIEKRVAVPVDRPVPVPVDRPVYIEKRVAVPTPVAVPVDRPVYVNRPVQAPVMQAPVYAPNPAGYGTCAIAQPQPQNCYGYGAGQQALPSPYTAPAFGAGGGYQGNPATFGGAGSFGGYPVPASFGGPLSSVGGGLGTSLGGLGGGFGASLGGYAAQDCCSGYTGGGAYHGGNSDHAFRGISDRIAKISARIADGENSGMITAVEAATLRKKIQSVSKDLTSARKDGRFEEKEIEVVAASVRQLGEQMKAAKQNEEMVKQFSQNFGNQGFGGYGMTPANLRPNFGAANAFFPGAQYPGLQQALPSFAFGGGFGGMAPGFGQF